MLYVGADQMAGTGWRIESAEPRRKTADSKAKNSGGENLPEQATGTCRSETCTRPQRSPWRPVMNLPSTVTLRIWRANTGNRPASARIIPSLTAFEPRRCKFYERRTKVRLAVPHVPCLHSGQPPPALHRSRAGSPTTLRRKDRSKHVWQSVARSTPSETEPPNFACHLWNALVAVSWGHQHPLKVAPESPDWTVRYRGP